MKNNNKFNKIMGIVALLMFSIFSINAVTLISDNTIQNEFFNVDVNLMTSYFFVGSTNQNNNFNNVSWTTDFKIEIQQLSGDMYLIYPNSLGNINLTIFITSFPLNQDPIRTSYKIELVDGNGNYYFKIVPDRNNENFRIEINAPDTFFGELKVATTTNKFIAKTNDITTTFVGAMKDFIDIQIGFWKIIYYLFIFSIILGSLGMLFGFGFKLYYWAEQLGEKKKELFSGGQK